MQRTEYGSWTRGSPIRCEATVGLPAISERRFAATACCPGCGLVACRSGSQARSVARSASADMAPMTSAVVASTSASWSARQPIAVITCVPCINEPPSFGASSVGLSPAAFSAAAPLARSSVSPSPMSTSAACASGARSPDAPTLPCFGMTGCTRRLSMSQSRSMTSARTPERPAASVFARRSRIARTNGPARVLRPRLADDLRRYAEPERPRRRRKALRQDGPGPDDRLLADDVPADQDRRLANKDVAGDDARVHQRVVSDGDVRADERGLALVGVDRRVVLHVRTRTDDDAIHVTAQHGPEPHGSAALDGHIADEDGGGSDERLRCDLRRLAPVAVKRHVVKNMPMRTRDLRVTGYRPLVPPAILLEELPLSEEGSRAVARARTDLLAIIDGEDDRLVAIFGPCSIHDPVAALDYARRLRAIGDELRADLVVVMRAYFMKPRTSVGWKGLV